MSNFRINVAKNGQHFFATADHSLTSLAKAKRVMRALCRAFPNSEGYDVSVMRIRSTCEHFTLREFAELQQ